MCPRESSYHTCDTVGAYHKAVHESGAQQVKAEQAAPWLHLLGEAESSSSCCVSAGGVTACQRDVHFSYDRLHHPQLLDRPKPAALLLGNFMGCSVGEGGSLWSCSPGREPVQSFVSWDYPAFLGAKLRGHLQSLAGCRRLNAASTNTSTLCPCTHWL